MSDIAIYRATQAVGGKVISYTQEETRSLLRVKLDKPVQVILQARALGEPLQEISLLSDSVVELVIPEKYKNLKPADLEIVINAEVMLGDVRGVMIPNAMGFGPRPTFIDGESEAIQRAVRWLLIDRGTDVWDKARGGSLSGIGDNLLLEKDLTHVSRRLAVALDGYNSYPRKRISGSPWYVSSIELISLKVLSPEATLAKLQSSDPTIDGKVSRKAPEASVLSVSLSMKISNGAQTRATAAAMVI